MTIKRSNKPKESGLPEASVVKNKHGTFRMEWASNNKVRSRRVDQRVIDRLVLDGKIFDTEYQMAQWYFELASSSIRMPNLVSNMNMEKVSGGGDYISNKQMNAMLRLRRGDKLIEEKFKDGRRMRITEEGASITAWAMVHGLARLASNDNLEIIEKQAGKNIEEIFGSNYGDILTGDTKENWFYPDQLGDNTTPEHLKGAEDTIDGVS